MTLRKATVVFKSVTGDNGSEFARLVELATQGTNVYFTHLYSSWEKARMSATISCYADSFPKGPAWPGTRQRTLPTWLTGPTHCRERYRATGHQMSCLTKNWIASVPSETPTAVCSSSGRGFAPPSRRTNRPHKDRHLSKLLQLAIAIRHSEIC